MAKKTKKKGKDRGGDKGAAPVTGSARRMIVNYRDGRWTEDLSVERYALRPTADGSTLTIEIEVAARERVGKVRAARQALRELVVRRNRIDTIQIEKPALRSQLRASLRRTEGARSVLKLLARGHAAEYPAKVFVGPDTVTLTLG